MQNQAKIILRKNIKKVVQQMSMENKSQQSNLVLQKVINFFIYKKIITIMLITEIHPLAFKHVRIQKLKACFVLFEH